MISREARRICEEFTREKAAAGVTVYTEIVDDLAALGVHMDTYFSEKSLYERGVVDEKLAALADRDLTYKKDGALWFKTTAFGDEKDRVLVKSSGEKTYIAADMAYHADKFDRGFDELIDVWGADHHGYVPRVKSALLAHGIPESWLSVLLIQLVKLWKGGRELKMSKRAGAFVTLQELVDEVGVDAVRFVFLTKSHDSPLDFDMDLVKKQDSENPVYYVQYAHARICSIFRKASEEGISLPEDPGDFLKSLVLEAELAVIRKMAGFPALLEDISLRLEPHRLTYYLNDLAAMFHRYFNLGNKFADHRIITGNRELSVARLFLAKALKIVIANGLRLLGVSAPERM